MLDRNLITKETKIILDLQNSIQETLLTDKEMFEQEEKETLSPRVSNTNWGGVKFRKTQSKRRLKKSKVTFTRT